MAITRAYFARRLPRAWHGSVECQKGPNVLSLAVLFFFTLVKLEPRNIPSLGNLRRAKAFFVCTYLYLHAESISVEDGSAYFALC